MSDPEYDPEFEAYLRRRVHLDRRLHSLARLEPPEELDRIIIGKARQAIRPSPGVPHFRAPKWAVPLGMAACLFMSFSLILDVGLRQATRHDALSAPMVLEMTNPAAAQPEGAPAPAPGLEEPAALAERSHFTPVRSARPKIALSRAIPMGQPHRAVAPVAAPPPAPAVTTAAAAAPATDSYASSRDEARFRAAELEPARGGGGYAPIHLASQPREMETVVVVGYRLHEEGFSSAVAAPITSVQSLSAGAESRPELPIPDAPAASNLAGSASPAAEAERRAHPDPKAWLDHIQKMQAVGLNGAAEQEMRLFRDAYPAYQLP
jgi:hypothetical protein